MQKTSTCKLLSIIVLIAFLFVSKLAGQQNGGFEAWSPSGSAPPFDWIYPTGWTTNNATTEFITSGVKRVTDEHGGLYAAQIQTLNIFGALTRSQLALGFCKLIYSEYSVVGFTGGEPLTLIPSEVSFFYKLTVGDAAEYAVAEVLIKRASGEVIPDTVFHASIHLPAAATYTEMHVPIPESGIELATDSIVIVFSSNDINAVAANLLLVDDVTVDFASATIPHPIEDHAFNVFPNPIRQGETLTIFHPETSLHDIRLVDISGRIIERCFNMERDGDYSTLKAMPPASGLYTLLIDGKFVSRIFVE